MAASLSVRQKIRLLSTSSPETRLDSWKEIAAYLGRDARTVQLWESRRGAHPPPCSSGRAVSMPILRSWMRVKCGRRKKSPELLPRRLRLKIGAQPDSPAFTGGWRQSCCLWGSRLVTGLYTPQIVPNPPTGCLCSPLRIYRLRRIFW